MDINGKKTYNYIKDISINYVNNILVQEIASINCIPFNFYKTDLEYSYELYSNTIDGIDYELKDYRYFITFSYISENKI